MYYNVPNNSPWMIINFWVSVTHGLSLFPTPLLLILSVKVCFKKKEGKMSYFVSYSYHLQVVNKRTATSFCNDFYNAI